MMLHPKKNLVTRLILEAPAYGHTRNPGQPRTYTLRGDTDLSNTTYPDRVVVQTVSLSQ